LEGESRASHSVIQPSSETALKRRLSAEASQSNQPVSKSSRSLTSMLRKAPEEEVRERHCMSNTQTTLPKKSKEEKESTDMYVADFIYDSGLWKRKSKTTRAMNKMMKTLKSTCLMMMKKWMTLVNPHIAALLKMMVKKI
jgi:hypothetical protein